MGGRTVWGQWSRLEILRKRAVRLLLVHLQKPHTQIRRVGHPEPGEPKNRSRIMLRSRLKFEGRMIDVDACCLLRLASTMTPVLTI
jgi:hypothetical protein